MLIKNIQVFIVSARPFDYQDKKTGVRRVGAELLGFERNGETISFNTETPDKYKLNDGAVYQTEGSEVVTLYGHYAFKFGRKELVWWDKPAESK